jgi:Patatin-like phospholipase
MSWLPKPRNELPLTYLLCAGMILINIAIVTGATVEPEPIAAKSEPHVLNLALPRSIVPLDPRTGKGKIEELKKNIKENFEKLYCSAPGCKASRALQINIALGNDYQILDWLGKGWVDAGVIPPLSLYLLNRDHLDLSEINSAFPWRQPISRSLQSPQGFSRDVEKFWERIWYQSNQRNKDEKLSAIKENDVCRVAMSSHLSTSSFLAPIAATSEWLNNRLQSEDPKKRDERENQFWSKFFDHVRFTFDFSPPEQPNGAADCAPISGDKEQPTGSVRNLPGFREYHFVIGSRRATTIFPDRKFDPAVAPIPQRLQKIFPKPDAKGYEKHGKAAEEEKQSVPKAFRPLVFSEPYFGVRTFAFTIDESMDLLRQQQQSRDDMLALILPGGGVKARFQSTLLEHLYKNGRYLRNYNSPPLAPTRGAKALHVDYIIGTSGGALLGFFLAQLGEKGPWEFSELLWKKNRQILQSTDVFGFFDMPRYFSFLLVFAMLCAVLWSPLLRCIQREAATPSKPGVRLWRLRLVLTIGPILALTPIIIRYINGTESQEHVPEIEGFFYTFFTLSAMFADQCLLVGKDERKPPLKSWRLTAGVLLVSGRYCCWVR